MFYLHQWKQPIKNGGQRANHFPILHGTKQMREHVGLTPTATICTSFLTKGTLKPNHAQLYLKDFDKLVRVLFLLFELHRDANSRSKSDLEKYLRFFWFRRVFQRSWYLFLLIFSLIWLRRWVVNQQTGTCWLFWGQSYLASKSTGKENVSKKCVHQVLTHFKNVTRYNQDWLTKSTLKSSTFSSLLNFSSVW